MIVSKHIKLPIGVIKMKPSFYNFFFPYEDNNRFIAYNSRSSALALIDKDKYKIFMDFCDSGQEIEDNKLIDDLKKGLFLIDDDVDELDILRFNMLCSRFSTSNLGVTIAPTSDCNFRCIYCYEKDVLKPTYMSETTQEKIIELLKSKAKTITKFSVSWYGGEPLLAFDIIEKLSREFISICNENNIQYSAGIITNGYLLSREKIAKLNDLKVNFYQVTIDGLPETHNIRRPLIGGKHTFDTIMNNLKESMDILPRVALRINIDRTNLSAGEHIIKILTENNMDEKIFPYLGKTSNDNNCYDTPECLNTCEFSRKDLSYSLMMKNKIDIKNKYPSPRSNFCGADNMSAFVIGADGELYRCWSDIGLRDRSFGNINNNFGIINRALLQYMLFDPTVTEPCVNCNILPICMGGCPFRRLSNNNDNCTIYKYVLSNYIHYITSSIKNSEKACSR